MALPRAIAQISDSEEECQPAAPEKLKAKPDVKPKVVKSGKPAKLKPETVKPKSVAASAADEPAPALKLGKKPREEAAGPLEIKRQRPLKKPAAHDAVDKAKGELDTGEDATASAKSSSLLEQELGMGGRDRHVHRVWKIPVLRLLRLPGMASWLMLPRVLMPSGRKEGPK